MGQNLRQDKNRTQSGIRVEPQGQQSLRPVGGSLCDTAKETSQRGEGNFVARSDPRPPNCYGEPDAADAKQTPIDRVRLRLAGPAEANPGVCEGELRRGVVISR